MPKVLKTYEIPDNPEELYIKLYCEQVGNSSLVTKKKAAQSWISLSHSKKKHFIKTCVHKQKLNTAQRIQSTEPFLKQLHGTKHDNIHAISEEIHHNEFNEGGHENEETYEDHQQANIVDQDTTIYSDNFNESIPHDSNLQESISNISQINNEDAIDQQNECNDGTEVLKKEIQEPTPPSVKSHILANLLMWNCTEIFNMLNTDKNKTFKDLTVSEKHLYRYILQKIRSDYIENYIKYLESLSAKELYAHYLKES